MLTTNRTVFLRNQFSRVVFAVVLLISAMHFVVAGKPEIKILALGDSLTHGYGLASGDTFPEQLEAALLQRGYTVDVINGGNSGDTTAAGLSRLDWALIDNPHAVIVELGANDGLRGIDPRETRVNLDTILARLGEKGLPVLLTGMLAPRNYGVAYAKAFDSIYSSLAKQHNALIYPFFLDGVALKPLLNQDDGIHPNRRGVSVIVERILPFVEQLIGEIEF